MMHSSRWPTVLEFLEFLELFWNYFGTGNVLENSHFFRLVLELFLNSEFLMSDFLGYNISGCPLFRSPICEKILFQFCRPCVLEKCENVLEMFFKKFCWPPCSFHKLYMLIWRMQEHNVWQKPNFVWILETNICVCNERWKPNVP